VIIKPFKGYRPIPELASKVALNPNNLLNEPERREAARNNPYSFAHVVKPRIDFPDDTPRTDKQIFESAKRYFDKLFSEGTLLREEQPAFYVYRLSLGGHTQTGLISCLHVKNYNEGKIKKHEHTRADKELENVVQVEHTHLNSNPVFLAYPPVSKIDQLITNITVEQKPDYDFLSDSGVLQQLWVVQQPEVVEQLRQLFDEQVPVAYIADGHHRAASSSIFSSRMEEQWGGKSKFEDYNYFLTALFPANQLRIYDYNRIVKNLNGLQEKEFLKQLSEKFEIKEASRSPYDPRKPHRFGMYLVNKWYKLKALDGTFSDDAVGSLDVTILQNNVLDPILGIKDPRIDKRIDFIPGIKGLNALEKPVQKGKAAVAFSLYPVTMEQLFAISDMGGVMPPKSTWFEPKLMSGLVIFRMEFAG
jgi:uncharacterized protein (DUF1015 family)